MVLSKAAIIRRILAISGIICMLVWIVANIYSENNYDQGLNLHLFSNIGVYLLCLPWILYYLVNYAWHTLKRKQFLFWLFGAFALFNLVLAVILIKDATEWFPKKASASWLFRSTNPPPRWLDFLAGYFIICVFLICVACFVTLVAERTNKRKSS